MTTSARPRTPATHSGQPTRRTVAKAWATGAVALVALAGAANRASADADPNASTLTVTPATVTAGGSATITATFTLVTPVSPPVRVSLAAGPGAGATGSATLQLTSTAPSTLVTNCGPDPLLPAQSIRCDVDTRFTATATIQATLLTSADASGPWNVVAVYSDADTPQQLVRSTTITVQPPTTAPTTAPPTTAPGATTTTAPGATTTTAPGATTTTAPGATTTTVVGTLPETGSSGDDTIALLGVAVIAGGGLLLLGSRRLRSQRTP